jgi:hypothetical protein
MSRKLRELTQIIGVTAKSSKAVIKVKATPPQALHLAHKIV